MVYIKETFEYLNKHQYDIEHDLFLLLILNVEWVFILQENKWKLIYNYCDNLNE